MPRPRFTHRDNLSRVPIPAVVRCFRNYARLEPVFLAAVEHRRLLADAIENVFVPTGKGSAPQVRSVAVGAERNQISCRALPALNALADERHGELGSASTRRFVHQRYCKLACNVGRLRTSLPQLLDVFGLDLFRVLGGDLVNKLS